MELAHITLSMFVLCALLEFLRPRSSTAVSQVALDWHCGFRLAAQDVPEHFRGPAVSRLARRIAGESVIDAAVIGAAQVALRSRPEEWRDSGTPEEVLQHLKQLWHVLVHYGTPTVSSGAAA